MIAIINTRAVSLFTAALPQKAFSFTPGFSPVLEGKCAENRFNGFLALLQKPLKRFSLYASLVTGLKPGVNERRFFEAKLYGVEGRLDAPPFIISSRLVLNSDPAFHSGYLSACATRYPIIVSN